MAKITIIGGAGTLGSATAFQLAKKVHISELCLIDINRPLLMNHIMDFQNAFPAHTIYAGSYDDLKDSEIVIITAGTPNRNNISSRNAFLEENLKLFKYFGAGIKKYAPDALIVTASNPVDVLNYYMYKEFQFSPHQLIGYTMNDTYRFEWAIRQVLDLKKNDQLFTPVLGEHGNTQVPIFSQVLLNRDPLSLSEQEQKNVHDKLKGWFKEFNEWNINRTTGWTTAIGISSVIDHLLEEKCSEIIASAVLDGNYSVSEVSLGVPISINKNGIQSIQEWALSTEERQAFHSSSDAVRDMIDKSIPIRKRRVL
ncbi:malate dehydrogenase [Thalassobacillus sp. CUG 92003]|uniref:malate dehydrogenase n=1 Tax=Thalassobacillus sp. CUG 92003 TaxID=2736641 RepID=UPI0015E645B3|nr:hypothetical protein [Thalassobacillus sp. CUG 92003]